MRSFWIATRRQHAMTQPLIVSLPHRLGRQEATRRLKTGLSNARANYSQLLAIEEETWTGDSVQFRVRALGQGANGKIDVFEDHVLLEVTLPWLLAKFAEKLVPAIRKEGVLMLEKK
jgi:hypothetical protein